MSIKLCCPHCGNKNIQAVTETNVQTTGGGYSAGKGCLGYLIFSPLGLLCGSCGSRGNTESQSTTYWICPDCGTKFRNPDEYDKELKNNKTLVIMFIVIGVISSVFTAIVLGYFYSFTPTISCLCLIPFTIFLIPAINFSVSSHKLEKERDEIEDGMKKFNNSTDSSDDQ